MDNQNESINSQIKSKMSIDFIRLMHQIVSLIFLVLVFVEFSKRHNPDVKEIKTGIKFIEMKNELVFSVPEINFEKTNYMSAIYLKVNPKNFTDTISFNVNAKLTCMGRKKSEIIEEDVIALPFTKTEIYTTWFPVYHSMAAELTIEGCINESMDVSLYVVKSKEHFAAVVFSVSRLIFIYSLITIAIYLSHFAFHCNNKFGFTDAFNILLFVLLAIANISNNATNLLKHCFYLIARGMSTAAVIAALFGVSMYCYSTENISTTILINILLIIAEGASTLTSDSYVLNEIFENNGVILIFFFVSSNLSKVSLIIFSFSNFIQCIIHSENRKRMMFFISFIVLIVLYIAPYTLRLSKIITYGCEGSAINFFCNYINNFIISMFLVQMSWPTVIPHFRGRCVRDPMKLDHEAFSTHREMPIHYEIEN